jgi:serine/threonine-protein kinase RsbW
VAVPNDRDLIQRAQNDLIDAVERCGYPKPAVYAIRLSVLEAMANAFGHGHRNLPPSLTVQLSYAIDPASVTVHVEDQGPGFDPASVPDPRLDENLEIPSGRGLMLIRAYMTEVAYANHGRRLSMTYRRPAGA